jgi:hypothetical protein
MIRPKNKIYDSAKGILCLKKEGWETQTMKRKG